MAALVMTAAAMCLDRFGIASTAAGCRVLFRGHAGFAVTGTARAVLVLLAACAGVQRKFFWFVACF